MILPFVVKSPLIIISSDFARSISDPDAYNPTSLPLTTFIPLGFVPM